MASQKKGQICGDRVRELCKAEEIKRKDLAEKLYITESGLGKIISGKRRLKKDLAEKINQLYPDYSVDWLLGESEYKNKLHALAAVVVKDKEQMELFCALFYDLGYSIFEPFAHADLMEPSEARKMFNAGYWIKRKKDDECIRLSCPEMEQLKKHINNMIALHMDYLFNTKEHLPP